MTSSITPTLNRRRFAMTAFGGLTAVALVACGGGSDGGDTSTINLREAFDKIQYQMTKEEVRVIVGRHEDDESNFSWTEGNEDLQVFTSRNDQNISVAVAVQWMSGSTTLRRELDLGE